MVMLVVGYRLSYLINKVGLSCIYCDRGLANHTLAVKGWM